MTKGKKIRYILSELKQNELYLNKVYTKNTALLICSSFDEVIQKRMLETLKEKDLQGLFSLMITEKQKQLNCLNSLRGGEYQKLDDKLQAFFTDDEWVKITNIKIK